jgi:uncharacterized membrane protein
MKQETSGGIGKARIEALADGVFAIALTLLILDVKVPPRAPEDTGDHLLRQLLELWPKFLSFVVSFLIVGVFWVGHHAQLHYVRRADRPFLWMNLVFLLFISVVPFSAALLGEYHEHPVAVAVYCGNLIAAGLVLYAQLRYADGPGQLFDPGLDPAFIRAGGRRLLMGPTLYAVALLLAFVHTGISLVLCALVPVLYILPGRVDVFWKRGQPAGPEPKPAAPSESRPPSR